MIHIEVVTLNVVLYARATNTQTLQKLPDGSLPRQSKLQRFDTDSRAIDALNAYHGHDQCCGCEYPRLPTDVIGLSPPFHGGNSP